MSEPFSDPVTERNVLAGLVAHGSRAWADAEGLLGPFEFSSSVAQASFACLRHALGKDEELAAVDRATFLGAASALGLVELLEKKEALAYLRALFNFAATVDLGTVGRAAARLRRLSLAKKAHDRMAAAQEGLRALTGDEPVADILRLTESPGEELAPDLYAGRRGPRPLGEGAFERLRERALSPCQMVGIPTGLPRWDRAIGGGLRRKTINVIGARTKAGKSQVCVNVALNVAALGVPCFVADTEMSEEDQQDRAVARLSGLLVNDVECGNYDVAKVEEAARRLEALPITYDSIAGAPFEEMLLRVKRWVQRSVGLDGAGEANPCVVFYDYLKLMSAASLGNLQEFQALGFQMSRLHDFAVRWGVPFLAFVQLNREGINREETDVISQSDRIAWLCSNFSILKEKAPEEMAECPKYTRKLVPVVCRHGGALADGDYINLRADFARATLEEGPTRFELSHGMRAAPDEGHTTF